MWRVFYEKWLRTHIEQEHHQNGSNSHMIENPRLDNVNNNNNNRTLLVEISFSGKT